ncbi:hypothetical protein OG780_19405 [Streptomyces sp. NBC_00386]|uniref:hypothetical protein n=1 Tax=Streptomyces sp. NBC_00386 TaxID=2975734 RepID=UPI002E2372E8
MDVNDIVAARIEAARRKAEQQKQARAELARRRTAGLARRHAAKLRHLAQRGLDLVPPTDLSNESFAASGA